MRKQYRNIAQNRTIKKFHTIYLCTMRGIDIFQNPYYREISTMRGRTMRGLPVFIFGET